VPDDSYEHQTSKALHKIFRDMTTENAWTEERIKHYEEELKLQVTKAIEASKAFEQQPHPNEIVCMDVSRTHSADQKSSDRLGKQQVCTFWLKNRCSKDNCQYLHEIIVPKVSEYKVTEP